MDITNELLNRQVGWINEAREEMKLAALDLAQPPSNWAEYNEMIDGYAKEHVQKALLHARRAAFAGQGLLYLPADDFCFEMDPSNATLCNECKRMHRCAYQEPRSDGNDLTALAKLQAGVGDMAKVLSSFVARDRLG